MKKTTINKIVAALIAGGLITTPGVALNGYAKTLKAPIKTKIVQKKEQQKPAMALTAQSFDTMLKTKLDTMVKANTITGAQEDAVISELKALDTARKAEMDKIKNMTEAERKTYFESKTDTKLQSPLANLVSSGTLTQAQADAIIAIQENHQRGPGMMGNHDQRLPEDMSTSIKTNLDTLVKAGTITQSKEETIISYFTTLETQRKAEMDKIKAMTDAERKAYFDSQSKTSPQDPLASLVTAGTITQTEADAVRKAIDVNHHGTAREMMERHNQMGLVDMNANLKTGLDGLVTAGTITQTQEDSVLASITAQDTQRKAEMDKVKNMTEAERKSYFDSQRNTKPNDPLASLVTAGTISQAQADAIRNITVRPMHR